MVRYRTKAWEALVQGESGPLLCVSKIRLKAWVEKQAKHMLGQTLIGFLSRCIEKLLDTCFLELRYLVGIRQRTSERKDGGERARANLPSLSGVTSRRLMKFRDCVFE